MNIERRGTYRNHGTKSITARPREVTWNPEALCVELNVGNVTDFNNTRTSHDWFIGIPIEELGRYLEALASAVDSGYGAGIGGALAPSLSALLKIALAVAESPVEDVEKAG